MALTINWKYVVGYEAAYEVSDSGAVRSLDRLVACKGGVKLAKGLVLQQTQTIKGYLRVKLSSGKTKTVVVHRLVAEAFIGARPEGMVVNHIDGNKKNNSVSNLEWCTHAHNNIHALATGLRIIPKGEAHPLFGRVGCRKGMKTNPVSVAKMKASKTGVPIPRTRVLHTKSGIAFQSIAEAARCLGVKGSTLAAQLRGQNRNTLGVVLL